MKEERILRAMTEIEAQLIQAHDPARTAQVPARKRRPLRAVLIAAAVAALMVTTALALSPTLRDALQNVLGLFAPYSQDMTEEEISCTDQGIKVSVVSALSDGNTIAIYFSAQDLTGDRLDEFTTTNTQIEWPEGQVEWKQGTLFLPEQIAYDKETKTALYCTKFIGDGLSAEGLTLSLLGQVFTPGFHSFDQEKLLPNEVISKTTLQTETLPGGDIVLAPLQNPTSLLDDCLFLSSCGFGDDGQLHIQLCAETGTNISCLRPHVQSRGNLYPNGYPIEREVSFERGGMTYYDFSIQAGPERMDDVFIGQLLAIIHGEEIEGEWRLDVPLESQPATVISMERSGTDLAIGPKADKLLLSPISCTIESDPQEGSRSLGYPLAVFLSDGSVIAGMQCDSSYFSGSYATNHWTFDQPIEPQTVAAIAIGAWYVPIENGTAQPGHWLSEQPR